MPYQRLLPLVAVLLVQLGACLLARDVGPLAISDDDYARVVIAERLAQHPQLDPTGTSWLPFPFYVTGAAMLLFDSSLEVARVLQLFLALAASALLYVGARRLGLGPWRSALGSGLAACLPTAALLAVATVPEYPTSACLAFALLCLAAEANRSATAAGTTLGAEEAAAALPTDFRLELAAHRWPLFGALACFIACGSRYEAWPIGGAYAGITFCSALRERTRHGRTFTFAAAALAVAFPVLWLGHGVFWHGDPFFFVARVTRYKAALGAQDPDLAAAWLGYPLAAVRQEPGATLLLVGASLVALAHRAGRAALRSLWPLFLALTVLLAVLVIGDVRGGAPTHHPERALLSLWLVAPALGLYLLLQRFPTPAATRWLLASSLLGAAVSLTVLYRQTPDAFVDRAEEERFGRWLQRTTGSVVVLTPDYGYFAVQAASGKPTRFVVVDKNDPREARPHLSPEDRARATLESTRAPWAVLPLGIVVPGYRLVEHGSRLALLARVQPDMAYALASGKGRGRAAGKKLE